MKRKQQDTPVGRFFGSRLFLIVLLGAVVLVAVAYARAYYQDYKIREEIRSLEDQVRTLETKKLESLDILKYVQSDAFVEETARTQLNLKKPGEQVVVIPNAEERQARAIPSDNPQHLSNPMKWWYYFSHKELPGADI